MPQLPLFVGVRMSEIIVNKRDGKSELDLEKMHKVVLGP